MPVLEETSELSPSSPCEDSDVLLSPPAEPERVPGIDGVPVRCACLPVAFVGTSGSVLIFAFPGFDVRRICSPSQSETNQRFMLLRV